MLAFSRGKNQWSAADKAARKNRPMLEYDIVSTFVDKALNPLKECPPEAIVYPGDGETSKTDAKLFNGWLRHIHKVSDASDVYMHAHERVLRAGLGVVYVEHDGEDRFYVRRKQDPTTTFFDPAARADDFSDAAFVIDDVEMAKHVFEEKYPDASLPDEDQSRKTVIIHETWRITDDKRVECVCWTDRSVLGVDTSWPGESIPFALEIGPWDFLEADGESKEIYIDTITGRLVQTQMDLNFSKSEKKAIQASWPHFRFWGPSGFMSTPEDWQSDKLAVEFERDKKPELVQPPPVDAASVEDINSSLQLASTLTGLVPVDRSKDETLNEASGESLRQQQAMRNVSTYHWNTCLQRMIRRINEILVEVGVKVINDNQRRISISADGTVRPVSFGQDTMEGMPGHVPGIPNIDLSRLKFSIDIAIGASHTSQRAESIDRLGTLIKDYPTVGPFLIPMYLKMLPIPGLEEVADVIQAVTLPPQAKQLMDSMGGTTPEEQVAKLVSQMSAMMQTSEQLKQALSHATEELHATAAALEKEKARKKGTLEDQMAIEDRKIEGELQVTALKIEGDLDKGQAGHHQKIVETALSDYVKPKPMPQAPSAGGWQ
jgi:hypothetical protein